VDKWLRKRRDAAVDAVVAYFALLVALTLVTSEPWIAGLVLALICGIGAAIKKTALADPVNTSRTAPAASNGHLQTI
jgi:hypothetical protein